MIRFSIGLNKFAAVVLFGVSILATQLFSQQSPFHGSPASVPGLIEVEDFDNGGEGIAYHDIDAGNNGGAYRETDVDIEACSEGGFDVGWIEADEWLEYTVSVLSTGSYRFEVRVASESAGGNFHIEFDGVDVTSSVNFVATGGWQTWATVNIENVQLTAGQQVMRLYFESSLFNVKHINVISTFVPDPPVVEITSPADNSDFFLGDDIQITATATDSNGSVVNVEFYADDEKIGEDSTEPYEFLWQQPQTGNYDLIAIATDSDGARGTSKKVDVSVNFPEYDNAVSFSEQNQFHNNPFTLTLSTGLGDASIKYTLDGSDPLTSGSAQTSTEPVNINIDPNSTTGGRGTTPGVVVRAVAFKNNTQQTRVATRTYIFVNEVRNQDNPGGNWPSDNVNDQILDYSVSQDVINDLRYANIIDDALLDIPSVSLVTDIDNLFGSQNGIYVNPEFHGKDWERPVSVELLNPDGTPGFQIDAGLRIRGGWSRHHDYPKHAFRLFFREEYGENKLSYPLFGDEGVDEFKKMDLRCSQNYSWNNNNVAETTMNRDVFSRDIQAQMGHPYTRSRYYHLYINGLYWGLFQTQERPEANFAESYLGGNDNDYDVVKVDIGEDWQLYDIEATDGNLDGWREVWNANQEGFSDNASYFALEGRNPDGTIDRTGKKLVDINNLIDYMIIIFYTGNFDAPVSKFSGNYNPNNFYAIYNRNDNDGFIFLAHDAEHTLIIDPVFQGIGINEDRVNIDIFSNRFEKFHPQWLHESLSENLDYRTRFADHVYRHFFNNGVLTQERLTDLFMSRANEIDLAIIAESMRWGDSQRSKHNAWQPIINRIVNEFFPYRGDIVLDQFRQAGLYSTIDPPVFLINGTEVAESAVIISGETTIELTNPNTPSGSIRYTLDGTDPRRIGGSISPDAINGGDNATVSVNTTTKILTRIYSGGNWSALHEITLNSNENLNSLLLTEIHYHPVDEEESGKLYEFIELQNAGTSELNLSLAAFINGFDYTFPSGTTLEAGEYIVLASHAPSFEQRYGFAPFGQFVGQLNNAGERIELASIAGDTLISVRYNDKAPWPVEADGDGPSLTWTNQTGNGDPNDALNWAPSQNMHGSPGGPDVPVSSSVVEGGALPTRFNLYQNYPNPFNPGTKITFDIQEAGNVTLTIYDLLGRTVETIVDKEMTSGNYSVYWNASNQAAGVYFYQIQASEFSKTRKMILLK